LLSTSQIAAGAGQISAASSLTGMAGKYVSDTLRLPTQAVPYSSNRHSG